MWSSLQEFNNEPGGGVEAYSYDGNMGEGTGKRQHKRVVVYLCYDHYYNADFRHNKPFSGDDMYSIRQSVGSRYGISIDSLKLNSKSVTWHPVYNTSP